MHVYIGLVGPICSGKSSATPAIEAVFGEVTVVRMSDLIRCSLGGPPAPALSRRALRDYANEKRRSFGSGYWMELALAAVGSSANTAVVIDGIRNPAEVVTLKAVASPTFTIGFSADEDVLLRRARTRGRDIDPDQHDELLAMLRGEALSAPEWDVDIGACLDQADFVVNANLDLAGANQQVLEIARRIQQQCLFRGPV